MKKLWLMSVVVLLGGAALWWYLSGRNQTPAANTFQRTATVRRGDLVLSISATGQIQPIMQVDVKSKASGEILDLPIEDGSYVKKGDLIVRLDRTLAQNDYEQAQANHAVAEVTRKQRETELKRQQSLFDKGLAPESDLDNARLAYEQANAQLVNARAALSTYKERLDDTEIHAPIDGVVLSRPAEVGQIISSGTTTVTGGTLLCTIANMDSVYVVADVDETDIGKVAIAMPATITPDAYPGTRLQGSVLRIAALAKIQQNVTIFEVTTLVDNKDHLLKSGMNATVEVGTDRADDVLIVPAKAIERMPQSTDAKVAEAGGPARGAMAQTAGRPQNSGRQSGSGGTGQNGGFRGRHSSGKFGVQVRRNGVVTWVPVKTGLSNLDETAILEGLAEGDTVIYSMTSGAMQQREANVERMRNMNAMPGMRRTN